MKINNISITDHQQNFNGIWCKSSNLSKGQKEISQIIKSKLKEEGCTDKITLADRYKGMGFDFVINPVGDELVTLDATNKFSVLKWLFKKKYSGKQNFNIGVYNKEATKHLEEDLQNSCALFNFLAL